MQHPGRSVDAAGVVRLYLLGGFRAELGDGMPVVWRRPLARRLVKLLATAPGHRLHREQIVEWLWPDHDRDVAFTTFRQTLSMARQALEPNRERRTPSGVLPVRDAVLSLDASVWIDADHFEQCALQALTGADLAACEAALAAYGGELLPEDRYEDWASDRRTSLANLHHQVLLAIAGIHEQQGAYEPAIAYLRAAIEADPTQEDLHRRLMRVHLRAGSRHHALRQYRTCRAVLEHELNATPDAATEELLAEILDRRVVPPAPLPAAIRHIPPIPLIGRERPREMLTGLLGNERGAGGLVLVGGEAGVGKSRLVAEAARTAHRQGALVLWGAAYEQEGELPYGPFVEALEGYLQSREAAERARLAGLVPELLGLLPSLGGGGGVPSPDHRARLFGAVVRLLTELGRERTVILVIDDLHAADPASLQLLHHLARLSESHGCRLVATYREEALVRGSALHQMVTTLVQNGPAQQIELLRLGRAESGRLLDALLGGEADDRLRQEMYERSLGNPLYLLHLVRSMQDEGRIGEVDERWSLRGDRADEVPRPVRELVVRRVDRMGETVQRTLAVAATAGMTFSYRTVVAAAARAHPRTSSRALLGADDVLEALDQGLEHRILEERGAGYAFRHPLLRAALYERLSRERRKRLHQALAEALEEHEPEEVEALAFHFGRAEIADRACLYLERAGDRARAALAHEVAERYYRELLAQLPDAPGSETIRARVDEKLGAALGALARYDEALAALERAATTFQRHDDLEALGRVTALIGRRHYDAGTHEQGLARIAGFLDAHGDELQGEHGRRRQLQPAAVADLYASRAVLCFGLARYRDSLAAAERAAAFARRAGDRALLARAEQSQGIALIHLGRYAEADRTLERAVALVEEAHPESARLNIIWGVLTNLAYLAECMGDLSRCRTVRERALDTAERLGDPPRLGFSQRTLGGALFYLGHWQEARRLYEQAAKTLDGITSWWSAHPSWALAELNLAEGAWGQAAHDADEAVAIAERTKNMLVLEQTVAVQMQLDVLHGHPDRAIARHKQHLTHPLVGDSAITLLLPPLVEAHLALARVQNSKFNVQRAGIDANPPHAGRGTHDSAPEIASGADTRPTERLEGDHLVAEHVHQAGTAAEEALRRARAGDHAFDLFAALQAGALVHLYQREPDKASQEIVEALALARRMPYPHGEARMLALAGRVCELRGQTARALEHWHAALGIFRRLGAHHDEAVTAREIDRLAAAVVRR